MRYTGPKFKLCRREGINLFGTDKYNVKQRRSLPGQHGANFPRLSEYWKLLRNKQVLKRIYQMSEKQFSTLVNVTSKRYAKNKWLDHDKVLVQFLQRRLDHVILASWLAKTIFQARQMVTHGHFLLNGKKHNVPSYYVEQWDEFVLRNKLQSSELYWAEVHTKAPVWLSVNKANFTVKVLDLPYSAEEEQPMNVDVLKVIEFYARA